MMKRLLSAILCTVCIYMLIACSYNRDYSVLASLYDGSTIKIEYKGTVYTQTGDFKEKCPGKMVFHLNYGEICSSVAYDVFIDGNTMYLKARQPFWADTMAVNFVLTTQEESVVNN